MSSFRKKGFTILYSNKYPSNILMKLIEYDLTR